MSDSIGKSTVLIKITEQMSERETEKLILQELLGFFYDNLVIFTFTPFFGRNVIAGSI